MVIIKYIILSLFVGLALSFSACDSSSDTTDTSNTGTTDTNELTFISSDTIWINENQSTAFTLMAINGTTLTYSISRGDADSFNVDSVTGVVTFKIPADYERKQNYSFTAKVTDSVSNEATQEITIIILDIDEQINVVIHNNIEYLSVASLYTDKIWLDKNLGANRACETFKDIECFGDYYQWGRSDDGHEKADSDITTIKASEIAAAGDKFIKGVYNEDWLTSDVDGSTRELFWKNADGSSICPNGYRVPTKDEIKAEILDTGLGDIMSAFNSFLKLPSAGLRDSYNSFTNQAARSYLWSSSPGSHLNIGLYSTNTMEETYKINAMPIRCVKN